MLPRLIFLKEDEQVLLEGLTKKSVKNGPGIFFASPFVKTVKRKGISLSSGEYVKIKNIMTGDIRIEKGPGLVFPDYNEDILSKEKARVLKHNEYMKLIDQTTGQIRVEKGEKNVFPGPHEIVLEDVTAGINVDDHTACLIRNTKNGSLDLVTEKGVFFPGQFEEVVEVRKKILLENHQTIIIREKNGNYRFVKGEENDKAFFLSPYEKPVTLRWSTGIHKDSRDLKITCFDTRPKFMWYEFNVRTKDNVELIIGVTFFWQIFDVEKMIATTDDAPGDLCSHARSMIIQSISKSSLDGFLSDFNSIIDGAVFAKSDEFYEKRGISINSVEVRSITCMDESTQEILNEIIHETTNRLNRLQKQESENEVRLNRIKGEVEAERNRSELIKVKSENSEKEAEISGKSEAVKVKSFFETLEKCLSDDKKLEVFALLKKENYIEKLGKSDAKMFFTPKDINLSIETAS